VLRKHLSVIVNQTGQSTHDLRRKLDIKAGNVIWLDCGLASGDVVAHRQRREIAGDPARAGTDIRSEGTQYAPRRAGGARRYRRMLTTLP